MTRWSKDSRRIDPMSRSTWPFCHGERGAASSQDLLNGRLSDLNQRPIVLTFRLEAVSLERFHSIADRASAWIPAQMQFLLETGVVPHSENLVARSFTWSNTRCRGSLQKLTYRV